MRFVSGCSPTTAFSVSLYAMLAAFRLTSAFEARQASSSAPVPSSIMAEPASTSSSVVSAKLTITVSPTGTVSSPAATSASGSNDTDVATGTYTGSIVPTGTTIPNSQLTMCKEEEAKSGPFPPFCQPLNETTKYVGTTYFITWWTGYFSSGTHVTANLDFIANDSQNAWHSDEIDKNMGFAYLPIEDPMLQGKDQNNLTLTLVANNKDDNEPAQIIVGPVITVSKPMPSHLPPPPPTSINERGLYIGLPVALGVIVLIIAVVFFTNRKKRAIGIGNVMGRRRKGYGIGKSRRQRVGKHAASVGVTETEFDPSLPHFRGEVGDDIEMHGQYRDAERHGKEVESGNAFREEIARQKTGR